MSNIAQQKNHVPLISMILGMLIIIAAIAIYFGVIRHQIQPRDVKIDGVYLTETRDINNFQLTDNNGKPFTKDNLKGHWTMMFFGFTNCATVCPTTMSALNQMYQMLQRELPDKKLPQIVLVSVDPERDTVERMNDYVSAFNSHFIGARANLAETMALQKQLHIAAAKMQAEGQGKDHYTINHSAEVMLFNPDAKLQAYMSYPHQPEQMVKDYKLILSAS